jgi:hypothetical protein
MKTLSIRQPYASLICNGIKKIENRSWKTAYRGKLLIHASGKPLAWPGFDYAPDCILKDYQKYYGTSGKNTPEYVTEYIDWLKEIYKFYHVEWKDTIAPKLENSKNLSVQYGYALPTQAIIGEAELVDIVQNSKDIYAMERCFHWVLDKPVLYEKPILNVMGKLQLWEYDIPK